MPDSSPHAPLVTRLCTKVEKALAPWREHFGSEFDAYCGHATRMGIYAISLLPGPPEESVEDVFALAAAYHDIGIWTDGTWDYLPPSARRLETAMAEQGLEEHFPAACLMVEMHHKLTPYRGPHKALVEAFRKADLIDLAAMPLFGLEPSILRSAEATCPRGNIRILLSGKALRAMLQKPWRPLPMVKW